MKSSRPLLSWALLGPACLGAWIALRIVLAETVGTSTPDIFARLTLGIPLAILGAVALTAPALYIGSALMKVELRPGAMLRRIAVGLDGAGLVMLGLMPAVLFLGSTLQSTVAASLIAMMAVGGSVVFGVRLLFGRLYENPVDRIKAAPVYFTWAIVSLGIGAMMFKRIVESAV